MKRLRSVVVSAMLVVIGSAGVIAARAWVESEWKGQSVDAAMPSPAPPIGRMTSGVGRTEGDADADRKRVERTLQGIVENLLRDQLGPGHRFELSDIEYLRLTHGPAEARVWGLLLDRQDTPSMLRVDMRLDRDALSVRRLEIQAYTSHAIDVERTAWLAGVPLRSGLQNAVARR